MMFVYYYVHVTLPFAIAERRLLGVLSGLHDIAGAAYREGEILRTKIGIGSDARPIVAKTVDIEVGAPLRGETETEVPISWKATGTPGLFPVMEAGIVVASVGPDVTQLTLRGSYDPPLGMVGKALDRTIFHRVAEASVKGLIDRVARSIELNGHLDQAV
jgi:hypothetical protein